MIDKSLVKIRFSKSMNTYDDNAVVQKKMAKRLVGMLAEKKYNSVLEIGSSTGVLTREIAQNLEFNQYCANDIIEKSKEYINKIIPNNKFIAGDIEEITIEEKYDLIISNAALQWCNDKTGVVKKLKQRLNDGGIIAFSIFGNDNFKELKQILKIKNQMQTNLKGIEEEERLFFNSPIEILRHIKLTGANALENYHFTKESLKKFEEKYRELYSENGKVFITYQPLYIVE